MHLAVMGKHGSGSVSTLQGIAVMNTPGARAGPVGRREDSIGVQAELLIPDCRVTLTVP